MQLTINIDKIHLAFLLLSIIVVSGIGLVVGWNTNNPQTFGHSIGEIDFTGGFTVPTGNVEVGGGLDVNDVLTVGNNAKLGSGSDAIKYIKFFSLKRDPDPTWGVGDRTCWRFRVGISTPANTVILHSCSERVYGTTATAMIHPGDSQFSPRSAYTVKDGNNHYAIVCCHGGPYTVTTHGVVIEFDSPSAVTEVASRSLDYSFGTDTW